IMYHPQDVLSNLDEFIELQNITATNVPLYSTFTNVQGYGTFALTNTWRLRHAVDFDFPTNTTLGGAARLLIVAFDPSTNMMRLAAFQNSYHVPTNVAVYGPWNGKLDNSGESLELQSPDDPNSASAAVTVPYLLIDNIAYQSAAPWPTNAAKGYASLQRRTLNA